MRIMVHDFAGHPFPLQLSQELARRGHTIKHVYYADLAGPKAGFGGGASSEGAGGLTVVGLQTGRVSKYSVTSRLSAHRKYSRAARLVISEFKPDCILSGNTPTDVQASLLKYASARGIRFIHWVQDFYSVAIESLLKRKLGILGGMASLPFHYIERRIFAASDGVIYISSDFDGYARANGYRPKRHWTIENWGPLAEISPRSQANPWSIAKQLNGKFVFLYSGTMGLKHSPEAIVSLSRHFAGREDVRVVVVTEGLGRTWLEAEKAKLGLHNLDLFDFQPYKDLPDVLGSASVVLTTLEKDSSIFCVPSKVLSYCCAGRPILVVAPAENLISRIVGRANAGFIVSPEDTQSLLARADELYASAELCDRLGQNARGYAESTFQISMIGDKFLHVVGAASDETATGSAEMHRGQEMAR